MGVRTLFNFITRRRHVNPVGLCAIFSKQQLTMSATTDIGTRPSGNNNQLTPKVLSIQSHVVSGYVGNKCAVFPLQVLGFDVDFINSVQFSNHTGYGHWRGQVLEEKELDDLFCGLEDNDLVKYTHLLTGYVASESFLRKIGQVVNKVKEKCPGTLYLCDPVLGDNDEFYVPHELIPIYQKEILPLADIVTPNSFELRWLSGMDVECEQDALNAMIVLHDHGVTTVVLTSLDSKTDTDKPSDSDLVTYISHCKNEIADRQVWKIVTERFSGVTFTGAGDLFAALFLAWYTKTKSIPRTLEFVTATMETVLARTYAKSKTQPCLKVVELELIPSLDAILDPFSKVKVKRNATVVTLE